MAEDDIKYFWVMREKSDRFNVYGIIPSPDTPVMKQNRIRQETDITWIRDERYRVLIAVIGRGARDADI
ncbi:MAG: hypothetical protein LBB61_08055 [Treponema sp.]|nr:hypothetical protein [Treponema sp.]